MRKIFTLLLCFLGFASNAQVWDMLHNKFYEFHNYSRDIDADQPYIRRKIDFSCFAFKSESSSVYKKIDAEMLVICNSYITNEAKFLALNREANARIDIFNEMANSRKRYERAENGSNPKLVAMACEVKSIVGNQAFYEVGFKFEIAMNRNDNEDLAVFHYYKADLSTGKVTNWNPNREIRNGKAVRALIGKSLNEAYLLETKKLNAKQLSEIHYEGDEEDEQENIARIADPFGQIDLRDADFYWENSGLVVQFQQYVPGTQLFNGRFFSLFFPYNDALKITALLPEFAFVNRLPWIRSNLTNYRDTDFPEKFSKLRYDPSITNLIREHKGAKVKSLQQVTSQINNDGSKRFAGKTAYEFDARQNILSQLSYNEDGTPAGSVYHDYDANGNILSSNRQDYDKRESTIKYSYDKSNNIVRRSNDETDVHTTDYFFYNGDFVYRFAHDIFNSDRNSYVFQSQQKNNTLCSGGICYQLDDSGQIKSVTSSKETMYQIQIGRNAEGHIAESHFEDDRYNQYFNYDNRQRLSKYQSYELLVLKKEITLEYDGEMTLPKMMVKKADTSTMLETYEWKFFR